MALPDLLHCLDCKSRLTGASADTLSCTNCERTIQITDGIADFFGAAGRPLPAGPTPDLGVLAQIQAAADDHWPSSLGDVVAFDPGRGETTQAFLAGQRFRQLLVLGSGIEALQACRSRIASSADGAGRTIACATLDPSQDALRDAVADTFLGAGLLTGIGDVRAFLVMVHRVLKSGGRAAFVVPNRRYYQAMCLALTEALVQARARDGAWPAGQEVALNAIARIRRLLVHRGDTALLAGLAERHLFDSEELEDLGREVGFASALMIPLDPDPAGARSISRLCQSAGGGDEFAATFSALAEAVGRPFFNLLGRQDASAPMLLWLVKGPGPDVIVCKPARPAQPPDRMRPEAALGGAAPRWSVELSARDTPDGVVLSVGGWCLCNTDVRWVRLTLDGIARDAPVWRPRPDVHDVLNRNDLYHPLNALCSGLAGDMLFDGVHAADGICALRLEVILTNGLVVTGPAPERLAMDEPVVIAH